MANTKIDHDLDKLTSFSWTNWKKEYIKEIMSTKSIGLCTGFSWYESDKHPAEESPVFVITPLY